MNSEASASALARDLDASIAFARRARRMAADGYGLDSISIALRTHPEQVRRWLSVVDRFEAAALPAHSWPNLFTVENASRGI